MFGRERELWLTVRLWVLTMAGTEGVLVPSTCGFVEWGLGGAITVRAWGLTMLGKLINCNIREDVEPHG